ncbi:LysR family transcriptional regulator [Rhodobacteraceae bacterium NNCM2]|nr:LysR family transcriptional regulator [Coraliihabitans acroporae]
MTKLSLRDLEAVLAIARRGSFRAAAMELDLSSTALSHGIARLEDELGTRLFNRTTRTVSLTEAGQQFVNRIGPALADIGGAMDAARSYGETPSGTLRINASVVAGEAIMSGLVPDFLRRYPKMQIDLRTEERLVDIVAEGFDLGVRVRDLVPADMIALSIGLPQRYAVVASPEYLADRAPPQNPGDLNGHKCIRARLPGGALLRWHFERRGETVLVDVVGRLTLDNADAARQAVLCGAGIGFFLEQNVQEDIDGGRMTRLLQEWTPPRSDYCFYYPSRRHPTAGMAAFLAMVREVAKRA